MSVTDSNHECTANDPQASENGWQPVGDGVNAAPWQTVAFTISVTDNSVDWRVFGAHCPDYSDEVKVYPDEEASVTVEAGEADSYAASPAPYRFYRPKIKSSTPNEHGTATIVSLAKAA